MHDSRLSEIRCLVEETAFTNDRLKGIHQLLDILRQPPAVHSFLTDMVLMFLEPDEALDLNCYESYRSCLQTLDILVKVQLFQRAAKGKMGSKQPLKTIRDCEDVAHLDVNLLYDQFCSWFANDPHLQDIISPIFPDEPFDCTNTDVDVGDMEIVSSDYLAHHEADEFELIDWSNSATNEVISFRHCGCSCHHQSPSLLAPTWHCGLCAVKFYGDHLYVWRGNRLVRGSVNFSDLDHDQKVEETLPDLVSPSKLRSLGTDDTTGIKSNWESLFRALDALETNCDSAEEPVDQAPTSSSSSLFCPPSRVNDESARDGLKQAFVETFGRNSWGRGYSPMKRPGHSIGIGGPNEESNSTSYVFVRGFDGANTMLAIASSDSNSLPIPRPGVNGQGQGASQESSPIVPSTQEIQREEETWTEDEDRRLLEQFKLHGNVYEAGLAGRTILSKSLPSIRDRLKFLLDLLKGSS